MCNDNTPPGSPEHNFETLDPDDILEVIDLDDIEMGNPDNMEDGEEYEDMEEVQDEIIPERDDAVITLRGHKDSVLTCTFHPTKSNILVTGGMDNLLNVWDLSKNDFQPIFVSEPFADSVDFLAFHSSGKYFAAADLGGMVVVFDSDTFQKLQSIQFEDDLMWLSWHPKISAFLVGSEFVTALHSVTGSNVKHFSTGQSVPQVCGRFLPDGLRAVAGYTDGCLRIWDLKNADNTRIIKPFSAEESSAITCIGVHKEGSLIVAGCASGVVYQANVDSGKFTIFPSPVGEGKDVEAIEYAPTANALKLAASAHNDGQLCIWDTSKVVLRHSHVFPTCAVRLAWHPSRFVVATCHANAVANLFDAMSGSIISTFMGHSKLCLDLDLNMDGSMLATVSDDETVKIFSINNG